MVVEQEQGNSMGLPSAFSRFTDNTKHSCRGITIQLNSHHSSLCESFSLFTFRIIIKGTLTPPFSRAISRFIGKFGMKQEFHYITPRSLITCLSQKQLYTSRLVTLRKQNIPKLARIIQKYFNSIKPVIHPDYPLFVY